MNLSDLEPKAIYVISSWKAQKARLCTLDEDKKVISCELIDLKEVKGDKPTE